MSSVQEKDVARGVLIEKIERIAGKTWNYSKVTCKCVKCGKTIITHRYSFNKGCKGYLCDCSKTHIRHGMSNTRIYKIYAAIKDRTVLNTNNPDFIKNYKNRGIGLCNEWQGKYGFANFYKWSIDNGYADNLSIDRIDNDKGYSPENCRWTNQHVQNCNRRNTIKATIGGKTKAVADWCIEYGIDYELVYGRLRKGWDAEKAIVTPLDKARSHKNLGHQSSDDWMDEAREAFRTRYGESWL